MTDWTPPEAMVEEIVTKVCSGMAGDTPYREAARSTVRDILAASPIGELVEAGEAFLRLADRNTDEANRLRAALARARGEVS